MTNKLQFYVVNERTEDTFEATGNFEDAVRVAIEAAKQGQPGDLVSIVESAGKSVGQFVLTPDGTVQEQPIAGQTKTSDAKPN